MTITSIISPRWVSYTVSSPSGGTVTDTIGLHRRCTYSPTGTCSPFPEEARCDGDGRSFCSMWRTTGFLMNFATIVELAAVIGVLIIVAGGKVKRQGGWKILGGLLGAVAGAEFVGMAIVVSVAPSDLQIEHAGTDKGKAYLFDHDDMFLVPGYRLDSSWYLCTISAGVALLTGAGLAISAFVLPPEDGYELLGDSNGV